MKKAISYVRFSTTLQAEGSSEERQLDNFRLWLSRNKEYEESNLSEIDRGLSAYRAKHLEGGLGRLLKAIEGRKISQGDAIVIESFDRISREDTSTALSRINSILSAGIDIITLEDGQIYTKESLNTSSIYILIAKIQTSHEYSKRLGARIKASWKANEKRLERGESASTPNRPSWIDAKGNFIPDSKRMILHAIDLYKSGLGFRAVLVIITKEYKEIAPKSEVSIKRWFKNESIAGLWRGKPAFQGLISTDQWIELNQIIRKRAKYGKPEERYLLSGILKCGSCDSPFNFRRQLPRPSKMAPKGTSEYENKLTIVYGNCSRFLKTASCRNSVTAPYEVANFVFEHVGFDIKLDIATTRALSSLTRRESEELHSERALTLTYYERAKRLYTATGEEETLREVERLKFNLDRLDKLISHNDRVKNEYLSNNRIYSYSDFEEGTIEQRSLYDEAKAELVKLDENIVDFRTELKVSGFKLFANRTQNGKLEITNSENSDQFTVARRSQKLGGYIVEAKLFEEGYPDGKSMTYLIKRDGNNSQL